MSSDYKTDPPENETTISSYDAHLNQLAYVGQISAGIAHEVRNPLTVVKGFLQLLQKDVENKYIDIAQSELENAITTLNNLLQLSKPDSKNEQLQTIHLAVELETILNLFQDQLYHIEVTFDLQHNNVTFTGRKNQLKKAFFNLIKNAIESMEGQRGHLSISHRLVDEEIVIQIQDTGVGIPEDKIKMLGTPFFSTKMQGTGMGLAQVYAIIYQHGGDIDVSSKENEGTTFTIKLPRKSHFRKYEVTKLNLDFEKEMDIKNFLLRNREPFEDKLLTEAINIKDKIEDIHNVGNINLVDNAHKLVLYIVEDREHELISFAKQEGIAWAKHSLTLAFKLEWIKAIRRTLWDFLYNYYTNQTEEAEAIDQQTFFELERKINVLIDQFFTYFFIHYSKYKDEQLDESKSLVNHLSAPIIPIHQDISILPLIGVINASRLKTIQDKILTEVEKHKIQILIIDMSGVAKIEQEIIESFIHTIEGSRMMGCRTIVTGMRSEIVVSMIKEKPEPYHNIEYKGTLQLALNDVLKLDK